jgi:hypothetical protein
MCALVVTSLFGSTLIASAQSQPAPGASSEGDVGPGATSGKKTKHEKGTTTGSSTRSGAKKGHAANLRIKTMLVPARSWLLEKRQKILTFFRGADGCLREQRP